MPPSKHFLGDTGSGTVCTPSLLCQGHHSPWGDPGGHGAELCWPRRAGGMGQVPTRRLTVQLML